MNSISRGYYESYEKERNREEECQAIMKCGCPVSSRIITTDTQLIVSDTIASLTIDNSCLCDPISKIEFVTDITSIAFAGIVTLSVFKQCRNQVEAVPIGANWTISIAANSTVHLSFFICDSDSCKDDCCTYSVVATAVTGVVFIGDTPVPTPGTILFNNATLGAISTCN